MADGVTGVASDDEWYNSPSMTSPSITWNSGSTPLEDLREAARLTAERLRENTISLPLHELTLSATGTGYTNRLLVDERLMLMIFEQRASEAERGLLAALLDNPSDATARGCYVDFLLEHGRCASAQLVRNGYTPGSQVP